MKYGVEQKLSIYNMINMNSSNNIKHKHVGPIQTLKTA